MGTVLPICGSRLESREEISVLLFDNEPLASRTDFTDAVDGPSPQRGPCRRSPLHRVRHLLDGLGPGDKGPIEAVAASSMGVISASLIVLVSLRNACRYVERYDNARHQDPNSA